MKNNLVLIVAAAAVFGLFMYFTNSEVMSKKAFIEKLMKEGGVVIDVRTIDEFQEGHMPEAINLDFTSGQLESQLTKLDKSQNYFLYCRSGNRSAKATKLMQDQGFEKVFNVGGYESIK